MAIPIGSAAPIALAIVVPLAVALIIVVARGAWSHYRRSSLRLSYDPADDAYSSERDLHLRLRVKNSGPSEVEGAYVRLASVTRRDGSLGTTVPGRELKWADVDVSLMNIPPGKTRLVDLAAIRDSVDRMLIAVKERDKKKRDEVPPGTYDLVLEVWGKPAKVSYYRVTLAFAGDWSAGQRLRDHVDVSVETIPDPA